jgi:glycerol-3-phosphate cytidylyltransferase
MVIGYTTGVFDLFHVGHLNLIRRARENCDRLIVGVSTDEVVEEYKGHRPIIPYAERVEIVKAIRWVDEVVPQTTMDKFAAWEKLRFNRLFHGNDWKGSAMYNEVEAKLAAVGVEVVYFPYTQGTSSTMLSERLRSKSATS